MKMLRQLSRDWSALLGLAIIVFFVLAAIFADHLAPFPEDAYYSHPERRLLPPGGDFILGTDNLGRDVLSRIILGTRIALSLGLSVVGIAMLIGVPLGLVAGYGRGWISETIMRITDIFLSVPQLILALAIAQLFSPSVESAVIALGVTYWPFFCRMVFADTRRLKALVFIETLQAIGAHPVRILLMHILPNAMPVIIMRATTGMGFAILTAASLSFLGMGAPPPNPDWGLAIAESRQYLPEAWWFSTFPGLAILLAVGAFSLLGDGLRDVIDPRLRESR
jgi:peptide/nickel transport system permease protein